MAKIVKVKDRPLDGRVPHMSISRKTYLKGLKKIIKQSIIEKKNLIV